MTSPWLLSLAVGLGGMLGATARSLVSIAVMELVGNGLPWGLMAVNALGSFLIGLYAGLSEPDGAIAASPLQRQFVLSGFCGGFTTFSLFSLETLLLVDRAAFAGAALHLGLSLLSWMLAVWLGYALARRLNRLTG